MQIKIGDNVKMTRRPYFSGIVKMGQFSLFGGDITFFIQWTFKPDGWCSKTPIEKDDLKLVEQGSGIRGKAGIRGQGSGIRDQGNYRG